MPGNAVKPITVGRLTLTPVTSENLRILWHVMRAPDLREYQDIPRVPFERFADRLHRRSARLERGATGRFEWLIMLQGEPEPIGWVSIRFQERNRSRGELGYSILRPWRRRGFAADAVAALTDLAFREDVVDTVEAFCLPGNLGSRGVLKRAGLLERERLRRGAVVRGIAVDVLRFDISRAQWLQAQLAMSATQEPTDSSDNDASLISSKEPQTER